MTLSGTGHPPAADPSMDDILASIRKILNEEEAAAAPAEGGEAPLELTEAMLVAEPAATLAVPEPEPARAEASVPETPLPELPVQDTPVSALPGAGDTPAAGTVAGLAGPATAAAAAALLGQLARTVAAERAAPIHRAGPSIEDVVREELRPMLQAWIDAHLPPLMERLVQAEIERVVRRSQG